jgi:hypothetical protein
VKSQLRRLAVVCGVAPVLIASAVQPADAHAFGRHAPDTTTIVDSVGSGEGNVPYLTGTDTPADQCHRSSAAYGPILDRVGLIDLNGFVACSGATPADALTGKNGEPPQVNAITPHTMLVLVQLGANPIFGQAAGLCIQFDCSTDPRLQQVLGYIQLVLPGQLDQLDSVIQARLAPGAKGLAILYANPFPAPGSPTTNCPYMNQAELGVAQTIGAALNGAIIQQAHAHGFAVADPAPFFAGRDVCGDDSAFFPVDPSIPQTAWLHPTREGQRLYALTVAIKILTGK